MVDPDRLRVAAGLNMAAEYLEHHPDVAKNPVAKEIALRQLGKLQNAMWSGEVRTGVFRFWRARSACEREIARLIALPEKAQREWLLLDEKEQLRTLQALGDEQSVTQRKFLERRIAENESWLRSRVSPPQQHVDRSSGEQLQNRETGNVRADDSVSGDKTVVRCAFCNARVRLARGKAGLVSCPECREKFFANTHVGPGEEGLSSRPEPDEGPHGSAANTTASDSSEVNSTRVSQAPNDDVRWAAEVYEMRCEPQLLVDATTTLTAYRIGERALLTVCKLFEKPSRHELSADDWRQLQAAIGLARFWDEPPPEYEREMVLDGVAFSLEGRRGERHRRVHVFNPAPGPFADLCNLLLQMARVG